MGRLVPKYFQVEQVLRRRIAEMADGGTLPSEAALCAEYGVSRTTLRAAIDVLVQEKRVQRIQGKGTFTAGSKFEYPLGYRRHPVRSSTDEEETIVHDVLNVEVRPAGDRFGQLFNVDSEAKVLWLRRVALREQTPIAVDNAWVPLNASIDLSNADFSRGRFFYTLADHGMRIAATRVVIESVLLDAEIVALLNVRPGLPGISLARYAFDTRDRVVAHINILARGDLGSYAFEAPFNAPTRRRAAARAHGAGRADRAAQAFNANMGERS